MKGVRGVTARLLPVLLFAMLLPLGTATPAAAAEVTTPYPAVAVEPGQTTTFELNVESPGTEQVRLRVSEAPEGWETLIRGGGDQVYAVYTSDDSSPEAQLEVQVPENAEPGRYTVTVAASAGSGNDTLPLELRVVEQAAEAFDLTTEFPTLQGAATDTFRFDLTLENRTAQEATFSLSASGPSGWTVEASPSAEQQAATVTVDAGASQTVAVEANPPDDVSAGKYELSVEATGQGTTLQSALGVEITGAQSFTLTTPNEQLNGSGSAGETGNVTLVIRNDGNAPLQDVELSGTPPSGWQVDFEPATVPVIPPGEETQVTAQIKPVGDAIAGDYVVTLNASSDGTSENLEIRYTVETSGWWGLFAVLVILAAIAALAGVYRRYGRR